MVRCLENWSRGVYSYRLYFDGISQWFEFYRAGLFVSLEDEIEEQKPNLRGAEVVSNLYDKKIVEGKKKE